MKLLRFDLTGLARLLLGQATKGQTSPALVQIVVQVIRARK
jgi:hypothetical protein